MDITARLDALDLPTVRRIVHRILRDDTAVPGSWRCDPILVPLGSGFTAGIDRIVGTARTAGGPASWSAVLKLVQRPEGTTAYDDPGGAPYWRREVCVYESGLLAALAGGLTAPRCFAVMSQPDDAVLLWLEEIEDHFGSRWPIECFDLVARHLGQFNGAYLAERPLPAHPWLASEPLRSWVAAQSDSLELAARPEIWRHPLLRRAFPIPIADRLQRLWAERETFLGALARLPRTFCHFDAGHHNLLPQPAIDGRTRTVAIDWEFAGVAAVGEEIGLLVSSPFLHGGLDPALIADVRERVFEGYLAGLRDAGWQGNRQVVRLGFAANAALRFVFRAPMLKAIVDDTRREREERRLGRPFEELLEGQAALTYALLDQADEARELLASPA